MQTRQKCTMLHFLLLCTYVVYHVIHLSQTKRIVTQLITGYVKIQAFTSNLLNVHRTMKCLGYKS